MITSLRLLNWKCHAKTELKFSSGTNALIGIMGSGKTAVMNAVTFALYGTFPDLQQRKIRLGDIIMNKPKEQKYADIELDFIAPDSQEYTVKRRLTRDKTLLSELRLKMTNQLLEGPNSEKVTEYIEHLLRMEYELFTRAVYAEQNQLDYFLEIPKGDRINKIDQLLRLDRVETARKGIGGIANQLQERKVARELLLRELEKDENILKIPQLEKELLSLSNEQKDKMKALEELEPKLIQLEKEIDRLKQQATQLQILQERNRSLSYQIDELTGEINAYNIEIDPDLTLEHVNDQIVGLTSEIDELKKQIKIQRQMLQSLTSDVNKFTSQILYFGENEIPRTKKEIAARVELREKLKNSSSKELAKEVERLTDNIQGLIGELESNRTLFETLKDGVTSLQKAKAECPTCNAPLPSAIKEKLIAQKTIQIETLQYKINELKNQIIGAKEQLFALQSEFSAIEKIEEKLSELPELELSLQKANNELSSLAVLKAQKLNETDKIEQEIEKVENSIESKQKEIQNLTHIENFLKLKLKLKDRKSELEKTLEQISQIEFDEVAFSKIQMQFRKLIELEQQLKTEVNSMEKLLTAKKELLKRSLGLKSTLERYRLETNQLAASIDSLLVIQKALECTQTALRERFVEATNEVMDEIWHYLYPYEDFTSVRLAVENEGRGRKGDYILQLRDRNGRWTNVEGSASGGERATACLALRIAFALVLAQNLSWLVLDEPTHNLDINAIEDLATTLRDHLPKLVNQILLITHEEALESAVSGYLYKLDRNKDFDEPTRTTLLTMPEVI
ncbi:MAG: SMC family ATPase [Euryarchaeota archaeon]|nr:SMC family ATPase [Euryarchaeota archaeon]